MASTQRRWRSTLRDYALRTSVGKAAWGTYRSASLLSSYRERRDHYDRLARERNLVYSPADSIARVRQRLRDRGWSPAVRPMGGIHTFAFIPDIQWHNFLLPDLQELGPVTRFDYVREGYDVNAFFSLTPAGLASRREMNERALAAFAEAHAKRPVDWVFVYASGIEISASTIARITSEYGVPAVNMCLDDKQSWEGPQLDDQRAGQIDIAPVFDLTMTSARVACQWYLVEGGRPLYLPEGVDSSFFRPQLPARDIPVSFVGAGYGYRPDVIAVLARHGVDVTTFGPYWPGGQWVSDIVSVFERSRINLGMGGIGYSEELTNVKTRDFEIPAVGGGVYLTSFNADLAQHFEIGREILCYRSHDELIELIRYYLDHDDEARAIAIAGQERCRREHRWLHRYQTLCRALGVLGEP